MFENGRPISPVFHFCKPNKQDYLRSPRYTDIGLLKLPTSRSVNTSLSSVLEDRISAEARNGLGPVDKKEYTVAEIKLPSYVSISCAINGYTNYSRFCRSRDNSPARTSFRKSSFEPSMLADMNGKEPHSMDSNFRYSRSQSDCNGRMHSVYTESKHVTVSKQLQIPLKSTRKYMTEVTITNGHSEKVERTTPPSPKKSITNGHDNEPLALAKEVGNGGTKSLVQQRIESLYGKSASEEIKVTIKHPSKRESVNTAENNNSSQSLSLAEKTHKVSTSPPVFRHLNKDFRKQLQGSVVDGKKADPEKISKFAKKSLEKQSSQLNSNGFVPISNGIAIDECDRAKSKTPPPKLSDVTFEQKRSLSKDGPDEEREGYKYLNLVDAEKDNILKQVKELEELQKISNVPEEASGKIRAACGKANLLISQKFEQFKGLCWKNIEDNPSVPFYTTASDLAGFWDLVMLQIDDINSTFKEIELLRKNNWKEVTTQKPIAEVKARNSSSKNVSRSNPSTPKRSTKSSEFAKAREEARKQLLAAKKKGRQQNISSDNDVAIFTPASNS